MSKKPETRQFPYRDAKAVVDALEAHASIRGRSLSGELRLAVRLWLAEALLAEVLDPHRRAQALSEGHDVDADERQVRRQITQMKRDAFALPKRTLRDVVIAHKAPA